jgi:hypothetical protein
MRRSAADWKAGVFLTADPEINRKWFPEYAGEPVAGTKSRESPRRRRDGRRQAGAKLQ